MFRLNIMICVCSPSLPGMHIQRLGMEGGELPWKFSQCHTCSVANGSCVMAHFPEEAGKSGNLGEKHLEMFAARQGWDRAGTNAGSAECLWGEGAQGTPGAGLCSIPGLPGPFSFQFNIPGLPGLPLPPLRGLHRATAFPHFAPSKPLAAQFLHLPVPSRVG